MKISSLSHYVQSFLQDYLTLQKGYSQNTVLSYRDTIKLLLIFCADLKQKAVMNLKVEDLAPKSISQFLDHLEIQRNNSSSTRNIRLACIHSFFRYLAHLEPLIFEQCHRILAIPFKRAKVSPMVYLEREEIKAILSTINCDSPDGFRDYVLFQFMYNTGARVQEVIDLPAKALQLQRPFQVRLLGKGKKERLCPLWPETVKLIRRLLKQRKLNPNSDAPIFVNHRGEALSRYGVRYLLNKYVQLAAKNCSSLKRKRVHPHTIRHTCAMHLLQAGVDINTIRAWLGHVDLKTTDRYAKINLEMKRKVLNKYLPVSKKTSRPWELPHCV